LVKDDLDNGRHCYTSVLVAVSNGAQVGRRSWRVLRVGLPVAAGLVLAACGTSPAATFHPAGSGGSPTATATTSAPGARDSSSGPVAWPPFGRNAHIVVPNWRTVDRSEAQAVKTAEDFLLAVMYADYTGDRDSRWTAYASPQVRSSLASSLSSPDVTTESFIGTVRFWHMTVSPSSAAPGAVVVAECVDSAKSQNTSLATGKVLPARQQNTTDENYYENTDVLASEHGQWQVITIEPELYYPQAFQCKP
jgi:hypothetical protein